jgi:predicted nucleic acid-binding Zn ribbon protein
MPCYDYECECCGKKASRQCTMANRNRQKCKCGGHLKQVYSPYVLVERINEPLTRQEVDPNNDPSRTY